jgi:hypothetical protein
MVNPFFVAIASSLAILTAWGFVSPRGQWRVLAGWSRQSAVEDEPGAASMAVHRVVSGVGIVVLVVAGASIYGQHFDLPVRSPSGPIDQMWGSPAPKVVNRVFAPATSAPTTLVNQKVLGYQSMDGSIRSPNYLFSLANLRVKGANNGVGYVGWQPAAGMLALDSANLVVHLNGDSRCIPQEVVVIQGTDTVSIGVFYGQPNPTDGSNAVNLANCSPKPSKSTSVLIPIKLASPLGARTLTALDGKTVIPAVPLVGN